MCEVGRHLWQRGLVGATEGNLSCRLQDRVLSTPSGVCKGDLEPDDLVVISSEGAVIGQGQPSSEIKMHVRIYEKRTDVQAIVHAHPPIATGFALAGYTIPDDLLPEAAIMLGRVAIAPFGMPGTDEVPDALEPFIKHNTFLLSNHGALALGKDLLEAYYRMETLERIAKTVLIARLVGEPKTIPSKALKQLARYLE